MQVYGVIAAILMYHIDNIIMNIDNIIMNIDISR